MVAAELKVVGGKHAGQIVPLNRRKFLIGREQDCQLRPNSEMVSRHHCVFSVDDYSVRLRDLGSTNGTLVNGDRIRRETVLAAGDRIIIGNLEFELAIRSGVMLPDSDSKVGGPAVAINEETQVASKTSFEMPAAQPVSEPVAGSMTQSIPVQPAPEAGGQTASASADTTMISPGQLLPGQYPYQPMMQPMGFPGGMYGGFPYQPMMPGYGQMYPQMPMMPQQMPPMGYPMQAGGGVATAPAPAAPQIEVSLPDPATTGAKDADVAKGSAGATKDGTKPTGAADSIIKQYMGRRPGS